jgi:ligand-binding SRPBCC domain-containing protein
MLHRLERQQIVPAPLDTVWAFFATPDNLNDITPADLHFEIVHGGGRQMYVGQLIEYRVQFMPLLKSRWLTEIAHLEEKVSFVDEQRLGPYRFWYHRHHFETVPDGTRIVDQVTYELPFGPLGDLVHALWVGPRLTYIFDTRREKVATIFSAEPPAAAL